MTLVQKRLTVVIIGMGIILMVCLWGVFHFGIQVFFNQTNSLPHKVFIGFKKEPLSLALQSYVVFSHPRYPNEFLIKRISGIGGDPIERREREIWVTEQKFPLQEKTSLGKPLTPLTVKKIPIDFVFVAGTHLKSFDSRYEEFGLIHTSQIRGQVWPLF